MSHPPQDVPGDYGYDMAHEDIDRAKSPAPETAPRPHATSHPGGTSDRGEDYGYDEAHSF